MNLYSGNSGVCETKVTLTKAKYLIQREGLTIPDTSDCVKARHCIDFYMMPTF